MNGDTFSILMDKFISTCGIYECLKHPQKNKPIFEFEISRESPLVLQKYFHCLVCVNHFSKFEVAFHLNPFVILSTCVCIIFFYA